MADPSGSGCANSHKNQLDTTQVTVNSQLLIYCNYFLVPQNVKIIIFGHRESRLKFGPNSEIEAEQYYTMSPVGDARFAQRCTAP